MASPHRRDGDRAFFSPLRLFRERLIQDREKKQWCAHAGGDCSAKMSADRWRKCDLAEQSGSEFLWGPPRHGLSKRDYRWWYQGHFEGNIGREKYGPAKKQEKERHFPATHAKCPQSPPRCESVMSMVPLSPYCLTLKVQFFFLLVWIGSYWNSGMTGEEKMRKSALWEKVGGKKNNKKIIPLFHSALLFFVF